MNEQTEKLGLSIETKVKEQLRGYISSPIARQNLSSSIKDIVLQSCKEAGLKFVPEAFRISHPDPKRSGATAKVIEAINSQIKEIEVE